MQIKNLKLYQLDIPMDKPFVTSLRKVTAAKNTVVKITTEEGAVGWGEAPPTEVITGDSNASIRGFISQWLEPRLKGENIEDIENITALIQESAVGNTSAKAAVEMAVYDLFGKYLAKPLYQIWGNYQNKLQTDMTISVSREEIMKTEAKQAVAAGFTAVKLKVGQDITTDLKRVEKVRSAVEDDVKIRLDANQGWKPKEAVKIIRAMENRELNVELVEQPVQAADLSGLRYVKERVLTPIMADESLFSPQDAIRLIKNDCCDLINIKLMKAGGLSQARLINSVAEAAGIESMVGCMLESKLAVTAAAHLAASSQNITRLDLDAPLLLAEDPVRGGITYEEPYINMPAEPGLGITAIKNLTEINCC